MQEEIWKGVIYQGKDYSEFTGTKNHWAKLSAEDVDYIRENYKPKDRVFGSRALGRKFDVDHTTITSVAKGTAYKYDGINTQV